MAGESGTYLAGFHDDVAVQQMKYNRLGDTELYVSELSLGGAPFGSVYGTIDTGECTSTVELALKSGINFIDTSPWYGQGKSEQFLGQALHGIPRGVYQLATKVGRYSLDPRHMFDFSGARVHDSVLHSLQLLRTNHVDLIQVHDLEFCADMDTILNDTLPTLAEIVESGSAKYIGITGYPVTTLMEVIRRSKVKIDCVLSYCRNNVHDDTLNSHLPFFRERNVGVLDASAMSMGLLAPQGPPAWHPASETLKLTTKQLATYCKERGLSFSDLCLKHFLSRPGVASHMMGVTSRGQLTQNISTWRRRLSDVERTSLQHIISTYSALSPEDRSWEGRDVAKYREAMKTQEQSK